MYCKHKPARKEISLSSKCKSFCLVYCVTLPVKPRALPAGQGRGGRGLLENVCAGDGPSAESPQPCFPLQAVPVPVRKDRPLAAPWWDSLCIAASHVPTGRSPCLQPAPMDGSTHSFSGHVSRGARPLCLMEWQPAAREAEPKGCRAGAQPPITSYVPRLRRYNQHEATCFEMMLLARL